MGQQSEKPTLSQAACLRLPRNRVARLEENNRAVLLEMLIENDASKARRGAALRAAAFVPPWVRAADLAVWLKQIEGTKHGRGDGALATRAAPPVHPAGH